MAAAFHTASLLSIIEQGQKMESLFVRVLLEAAVKLSTITDANIFVMVETVSWDGVDENCLPSWMESMRTGSHH